MVPEGPINNLEDDWNEFSPRVALQYSVNDDLMVFGSFASGFKSGGFFARTQDIYNLNSYDPEYVDTWELGMKSEWWDNRLRLNATAFLQRLHRQAGRRDSVANATGEVGTVVTNASEVEIYGLEVELNAVLTSEALHVCMNLGLLESEYSEFRRGPDWRWHCHRQLRPGACATPLRPPSASVPTGCSRIERQPAWRSTTTTCWRERLPDYLPERPGG